MISDTIKKKASRIKLILLDVDGTMTDGGIYFMADGSQMKRFFSQDGEGIMRSMKSGIEVGIISAAGQARQLIEARAKALGIKRVHAERSDKVIVAETWAKELGLDSSQVAYMGDDIIDSKVMKWCGLSAAPSNAHKSAQEAADIITHKSGGHGAVREFIDIILENV